MTVQRPLARVERDVDACAVGERAPDGVDLASVRTEQRQRRTRPREEADVDSLRHVGEQLPQRPRILMVEAELRREEPPREPDRRAAPSIARAICGSASAPSTRTSSALPATGSLVDAQPPADGASAKSWPRRSSLRR